LLDVWSEDIRQLWVSLPTNGEGLRQYTADLTRLNDPIVEPITEFAELGLFGGKQ
jgi:hypothetical protein